MTIIPVVTPPDLLFGVDAVWQPDPAEDRMLGRMTLDARHQGPDGRTAAGALGVLVDEVLGYSIIASLPPRSWTVSTEIWVDVIAPIPSGGPLTGDASTVQIGSYSRGLIVDGSGHAVAECRERARQISEMPNLDSARAPGHLDCVGEQRHGLVGLLGLRGSANDLFSMEVSPQLENPRRMLHGGVSFAAAEAVATQHRLDAGCRLATTSIHVIHTRGAPFGAEVEFSARVVHAGRTLWVTDVTGAVDGRVVVSARVTAQ